MDKIVAWPPLGRRTSGSVEKPGEARRSSESIPGSRPSRQDSDGSYARSTPTGCGSKHCLFSRRYLIARCTRDGNGSQRCPRHCHGTPPHSLRSGKHARASRLCSYRVVRRNRGSADRVGLRRGLGSSYHQDDLSRERSGCFQAVRCRGPVRTTETAMAITCPFPGPNRQRPAGLRRDSWGIG